MTVSYLFVENLRYEMASRCSPKGREAETQIRRASRPCGGEKYAGKSVEVEEGAKERESDGKSDAPTSETRDAGVTNALKSMSGECSPLQQTCLESGAFGVGECSWHPKSPCVLTCAVAVVIAVTPDMQEICNNSASTAVNAATLTVNWTIERMPMRSSQNQGNNVNSNARVAASCAAQEFCPEFVKRILFALAGGYLCPP